MSLIALAGRVRHPRTLTRSLLMLLALTAAVIVGLLAMHSLNSHTAPAAASTSVISHDVTAQTHHSEAPASDAGCTDCVEHDGMLMMACVLALLATLLLLVRPTRQKVSSGTLLRAGPTPVWHPGAVMLRPPSLLVLCISRT